MKCRQIQDLILTDYTDNEAPEAVRRQVEEHLAACSACRQFQAAVRARAVEPLQEAERAQAPARLWSRVTSAIYAQPLEPAPAGVLERIKNLVAAPRPALALSTVAVLLVFGAVLGRLYFTGSVQRHQLAEAAVEEQIDYFAYGNVTIETDILDIGLEEIFS